MTLRTLNYGNYGIFLIMGNAGFCPSTVIWLSGFGVYRFRGLGVCLGSGFRVFRVYRFRGLGFTVGSSGRLQSS